MYQDIKTFDDACKALGITYTAPLVPGATDDMLKAITAHHKLMIIAQALNGDWKPNWNDSNGWKYYPYFNMKNGFSFVISRVFYQDSFVGSRLCFRSADIADYAGTQFLDLYKEYFTYQE